MEEKAWKYVKTRPGVGLETHGSLGARRFGSLQLSLLADWTMAVSLAAVGALILVGCKASPAQKANNSFFTSGSRQADQRAEQRMAQAEQLEGSGEGSGEKGVKKAHVLSPQNSGPGDTNQAAKAEGKLPLYARLGGQAGISNLVADFTARVLVDPRVNWDRKGVKRGGFSLHHNQSVAWQSTPQNVRLLETHMVEFLGVATGGPPKYTGKEIQGAHAGMHISNPEFDAAVGDLKASLDKLQIPNLEQKELLAIIESTRPQIVTER
jgi:hemoglobin